MFCWHCFWGWPKPIADIYDWAKKELGGEGPLHWGPAHIVWEDENFDSAQWCLDNFNEYKHGYADWELDIVRQSLEKLAALPEELKTEPPGYDEWGGESDPKDFPPPKGWVMVKR